MSGISGIPLSQFKTVAEEKPDGDLRVSRGDQDKLVNKGTILNKIATFFESIGRALGLIDDDTRKLRQQEAIRGFADSLKDHYGPDVARRAMRTGAGLVDDHPGLDPEQGPHNLVGPFAGGTLESLTGRVTLQILDQAETLRRQGQERVDGIMLDALHGGQFFESMKNDPELQALGLDNDLRQRVGQEYETRLRERFQLECDSGRRTIPPFPTKNDLTEAKLQTFAREELVGVLTDVRGEGTEARQRYQHAMSTLLDRVIDGAGAEDIQQAIEESLKALKARQEIGGRKEIGGRRLDDGYVMEQTLIGELEKRLSTGQVDRQTLETLRRGILDVGSTLRQLHERNTAPLRDTRPLDGETERQQAQERLELKDHARQLMGPPVALVGALARVLGSVTNLHGNDIGAFTGRN
jgi:hypothetical protein